MSEHFLRGKTVNLKYGVTKEDNKLRFTFCGLDTVPDESIENPYLFNQILEHSELILKFDKPETIEYAQREVFTLETCISVYLIDYIKSRNDLSHITPEMLETIYTSEEINKEFTKVVETVSHAVDKESFFQNENSALSLIHDAFRINDLSFEEPVHDKKDEEEVKIHQTQEEDYVDDDVLDELEASIASQKGIDISTNETLSSLEDDNESFEESDDDIDDNLDKNISHDNSEEVHSIKSFSLEDDENDEDEDEDDDDDDNNDNIENNTEEN